MSHFAIQWILGLCFLAAAVAAQAEGFNAATATTDSVVRHLNDSMADPEEEAARLVADLEINSPTALSFSADGEKIAVTHGPGRNSEGPRAADAFVIDIESGQIVRRIELTNTDYPSAVALTPDGRHLVLANGKRIDVYDESNNIVHTHEGFESGVNHLEVTDDGKYLIAADKSCIIAKLPVLGGDGWQKKVVDWKKGFHLFDAAGDGSCVTVADRKGMLIEIVFPNAEEKQARATNYGDRFKGVKVLARGNKSLSGVKGFNVICGLFSEPNQVNFANRRFQVPGMACLHMSDDNKILTVLTSDGIVLVSGVEAISIESVEKLDIARSEYSRPDCWISKDANVYVYAGAGRLKVWKPTGRGVNQKTTFHETVQALFDERRYEVLSGLCRRILDQDGTQISIDQLRPFLLPSKLAFGAQQRILDLEAWYDADPDLIYPKLILAQIEKDRGFHARGTRVVSQTTDAQFEAFEKHIAKSADYLDGYKPNKNTPAEYYELRISQHLGGHKPEDFTQTIDALIEFQPRLLNAHSQAMLFLMPRWHGSPGDCEAYADRLAKSVGGHEGERLYAVLAECLLTYYPSDEYFELTHFKYERLRKYFDAEQKLAESQIEKDRLISQQARFARRAEDFTTALAALQSSKASNWKKRNLTNQREFQDMLRIEKWLIQNQKMGGVVVNPDGTIDMKKIPPIPKD